MPKTCREEKKFFFFERIGVNTFLFVYRSRVRRQRNTPVDNAIGAVTSSNRYFEISGRIREVSFSVFNRFHCVGGAYWISDLFKLRQYHICATPAKTHVVEHMMKIFKDFFGRFVIY